MKTTVFAALIAATSIISALPAAAGLALDGRSINGVSLDGLMMADLTLAGVTIVGAGTLGQVSVDGRCVQTTTLPDGSVFVLN